MSIVSRTATLLAPLVLASALLQSPVSAQPAPESPATSEPTPTEPTPTEPTPTEPTPTEPTPSEPTPTPTPTPIPTEPTPTQPTPSEPTPPTKKPKLMIVGDSISGKFRYRYRADKTHVRAWWSYVAADLAVDEPTVSALAGSGMLARGTTNPTPDSGDLGDLDDPATRCSQGTTFGERLDHVKSTRPDILIVAGGRNDFKTCNAKGTSVRATSSQIRSAIRTYMADLRTTLKDNGLSKTRVYVMTPWATSFDAYRDTVTTYTEQYARRAGFTWIPLPALQKSDTVDGTHPTGKGSEKLARMVIRSSDLLRTYRSAANVQVRCTGVAACRAQYPSSIRTAYGKARSTRYWGQRAGVSSTNYAAYRLTHHGRRTARIPGGTPFEWRAGARAAGVPLSGRPTIGSIAWWPADPLNPGDGTGHVAYVEQVSADGTAVVVSEYRKGRAFQVVKYQGSAFPRGFMTFPTSRGTPSGAVTSVTSTRTRTLTLTGFVTDPDAYGKGVALTVGVTKGKKSVTLPVSGKVSSFDFTRTVRSSKLPRGKVTVTVRAHNVTKSKGTSRVSLRGARSVTIR